MAVPYMRQALRGWTKRINVELVTQTVVNHVPQESTTTITLDMNLQPMPTEAINRKPEGQRSWKWWSFFVKGDVYLEPDTIFIVDGKRFRVEKTHDWRSSGFTKGEAVEDYER